MATAVERLATKLLLQQLLNNQHLELEGDPEDVLGTLCDTTAEWLVEHIGEPDCAEELAVFFEEHPCIAEIYADEETLVEKLAVWESATRRFATPIEHRDPALEQQILDNPDDDAARLVYADVLQQHGDPLGELVARHAANNSRAAKRLLTEHGTFFFGPVEEYVRLFKLEYHLGFIRSITMTRKQHIELEWPVVAGWLLERPIARFVEQIAIGPVASYARDPEIGIWNAVFAAPRTALRSIAMTSKNQRLAEPLELSRITLAPRLREVRIEAAARVAPEPFEHPSLRSLAANLEQGNELAASLVDSHLPALEELDIRARWNTTARKLWPRDAPALRTLRIARGNDPSDIVETLLVDPILPQLAELELSHVSAATARVLAANAQLFAHLKKLSLPHHELRADALRALAKSLPLTKS